MGRPKGYCVSNETKLKISETLKSLGIVPPSRKGCEPWHKGKKLSPLSKEHKEKVSLGVKKYYDKKGRITPHRLLLRTSKEYLKFRRNVFEKDDYTCQNCGINSNKLRHRVELNVHHIIPVSKNINLIFEIDNGITLCKECHMELHLKKNKIKAEWG